MPPGTYRGAKRAAERGDPLPLVCNCAHDDCVCPDGRHPPPAALALSNKRKAAMASIPERDEEDEDDDEEFWAELTGPGSLMNQDQGSANNNIDEEESLDDGRDGPRDSFGPAAAPSEPQRSSKETARVAKRQSRLDDATERLASTEPAWPQMTLLPEQVQLIQKERDLMRGVATPRLPPLVRRKAMSAFRTHIFGSKQKPGVGLKVACMFSGTDRDLVYDLFDAYRCTWLLAWHGAPVGAELGSLSAAAAGASAGRYTYDVGTAGIMLMSEFTKNHDLAGCSSEQMHQGVDSLRIWVSSLRSDDRAVRTTALEATFANCRHFGRHGIASGYPGTPEADGTVYNLWLTSEPNPIRALVQGEVVHLTKVMSGRRLCPSLSPALARARNVCTSGAKLLLRW